MSRNAGTDPEQDGCSPRSLKGWRRSAAAAPARDPASGPLHGAGRGRAAAWVSVVLAALALLGPGIGFAAEPTAATAPGPTAPGPAASGSPAIEEWLNQSVRLRDTVKAMTEPSADAKPAGEIRAGAEVKAVGLVAGRRWVQIELPDRSLAYVPREAIEFEGKAGEPGSAAGAPGPPTAEMPAAGPRSSAPASGAAAPPAGTPAAASVPGAIRGPVTKVPNAATLVVADQRIRLSGVDPGPQEALPPFENWVRGQGALVCEPDAQTGRYHCFTGGGVDVGEAAILNGAGRVGDGATPAYRQSEAEARQGKRGIWAQP